MKGFIIALQFLTRIPGPSLSISKDDFARSMRWFPAVGLVIGLMVAGSAFAGNRVDGWTGAVLALIAWTLVTGALHLDGLGDMADASGATHKDRERLLSVLADPHIGSFGAVAIGLQLITKLVLLHAAIAQNQWQAIIFIPFLARIAPLIWTLWLPPLHDGLGARFRGAIRPIDILFWLGLSLIIFWYCPAFLVVLPFVAIWGWWVRTRIGGISGDGHGAGIELSESLMLLTLTLSGAVS